jgi:hypothetical protein
MGFRQIGAMPRRKIIKHTHGYFVLEQHIHGMRTDKAGTAGYKDFFHVLRRLLFVIMSVALKFWPTIYCLEAVASVVPV